ncbi:acetylesterase [Kibdelosporangium aridum]|uniref:Acetylesterase n=1 Tax=Kibdelosporangium aridum TaxID=2030 RepID=A0A428ZAE5_KIBAR|nr:hypothetical protein [Kibdelosporangium aridum]RSM85024.1 acetylesterase [Kibdelosporangium aridum]
MLRSLASKTTWDETPADPIEGTSWERDGVRGSQVSWSVGYGPRTEAWILRPATASGPLPGLIALHGHDGFKFHGKEKIADGPTDVPAVATLRREMYGGVAFANYFARQGFTVLVPDVFLWGSRRFPIDEMRPGPMPGPEHLWTAAEEDHPDRDDIAWYNRLAARHEHLVAKFCTIINRSLTDVVSYEDRVAARYLRSRTDLVDGPIGCVGLSGGGCRAALLHATCDEISAAVVVGMMSTYGPLLEGYFANHTWMFFPPGLRDWPDLAARRAPIPLLVQYLLDDDLFPTSGIRAADARLTEIYGRSGEYTGQFYPGPHRFDPDMHRAALSWLRKWLF